jgi:hypothetical protein
LIFLVSVIIFIWKKWKEFDVNPLQEPRPIVSGGISRSPEIIVQVLDSDRVRSNTILEETQNGKTLCITESSCLTLIDTLLGHWAKRGMPEELGSGVGIARAMHQVILKDEKADGHYPNVRIPLKTFKINHRSLGFVVILSLKDFVFGCAEHFACHPELSVGGLGHESEEVFRRNWATFIQVQQISA